MRDCTSEILLKTFLNFLRGVHEGGRDTLLQEGFPLLFFFLGEKTASFQMGSSILDLNVLGAPAFNTLSSHVATLPWVFCPFLSPQ